MNARTKKKLRDIRAKLKRLRNRALILPPSDDPVEDYAQEEDYLQERLECEIDDAVRTCNLLIDGST